jgi:hypothetical protein
MDKLIQENIEYILFGILLEQDAAPGEEAGGGKLETDNAPSSDPSSPFTPAEQKFLGKFDAYGAKQLGIIYSISDEGIREFMNRSGKELNCTTGILLSLLRDGIIKIVPYTGYGRNVDYTIELQLSLDDVKGMGAADKEKAEAGSSASGAPAGGDMGAGAPPPPPPGPTPSEWIMGYGDLLTETTVIASKILNETKHKNVYVNHSRILKDLPKRYIEHLNAIIDTFGKKKYSVSEKQRLIADILDTLMVNMNLTAKQIQRSYEMHRDQKKLKKIIDEK